MRTLVFAASKTSGFTAMVQLPESAAPRVARLVDAETSAVVLSGLGVGSNQVLLNVPAAQFTNGTKAFSLEVSTSGGAYVPTVVITGKVPDPTLVAGGTVVPGTPGKDGAAGVSAPVVKPSYVSSLTYPFNSHTGWYNLKASNTRKAVSGLARMGSRKFQVLAIGDSSLIGYNGTNYVASRSIIRQMFSQEALGLSTPPVISGYEPALYGQNAVSDRWGSATGGINYATFPCVMTIPNTGAITYTSDMTGTGIAVYYSAPSTQFTVSVDGAAAVQVTPNAGGAPIQKYSVTGLSNATHTVRITSQGNYTYLVGTEIIQTAGIGIHMLGYGGSTAAYGGVSKSWTDQSQTTSVSYTRQQQWVATGYTPDLVMCVLGSNDMFQGDTPANAINGLRTLRGWYPNSDFILIHNAEINGTNMTNYNSYSGLKYALADELDVPLIDFSYRFGGYPGMLATGMLGADSLHASDDGHKLIGKLMGNFLRQ